MKVLIMIYNYIEQSENGYYSNYITKDYLVSSRFQHWLNAIKSRGINDSSIDHMISEFKEIYFAQEIKSSSLPNDHIKELEKHGFLSIFMKI